MLVSLRLRHSGGNTRWSRLVPWVWLATQLATLTAREVAAFSSTAAERRVPNVPRISSKNPVALLRRGELVRASLERGQSELAVADLRDLVLREVD